MRFARLCLGLFCAVAAGDAVAQSAEDVLGRWCSSDGVFAFSFRRDAVSNQVMTCRAPMQRSADGGFVYSGRCQFEDGPQAGRLWVWFGHDDRLIVQMERGGRRFDAIELFRC